MRNRGKCLAAALTILMCATPAAAADIYPRAGRWVGANHVLLRTEMSGGGEDVVVLVHDMGLNLEAWDEIVPSIQDGRRILRYDLRGFGLSEKFRGPISVEDHVEDLHALLDAMGIKGRVTLVGGSIGGTIVIKFAAKYPERVRAVVSLNGLTKLPNPPPPANPNLVGRDTAALFETEGVRAYLRTDLDWLYPPQLRTTERLARLMGIEVAQDPSVRAQHMRMKSMAADFTTELPRIKAPVMFIAGMINSSYSADEWRMIAHQVPGAELVMLQTAHHAAFESPELVLPPLRRFLDKHRAGKAGS